MQWRRGRIYLSCTKNGEMIYSSTRQSFDRTTEKNTDSRQTGYTSAKVQTSKGDFIVNTLYSPRPNAPIIVHAALYRLCFQLDLIRKCRNRTCSR
jgi:hypothetical protein